MWRLLAEVVFASLLLGMLAPVAHATPARPNILLILIDDLNDDVGFLGSESAVTPHLDALASQGVVFDRAYAQAPLCNPSRVSLLTGTYPSSTGTYGLKPDFWEVPALAQLQTLPEYFRRAGYRTGMVGKVFHQQFHEPSFDDVIRGWFGAFGPFPPTSLEPGLGERFNPYFDWGPWQKEQDTPDYKVGDAASRMLLEATGQAPFFLSVGFFRPHNPRFAPQPFFDLHPLEGISVPPPETDLEQQVPAFGQTLVSYRRRQKFNAFMRGGDRGQRSLQAYRAAVSLVDQQIGRLLDTLEASGAAGQTIVVVASDHGVQNGEKNLWFKRTLWEGSTRVPLVIALPGAAPRRVQSPVGLIDLFPTLTELAGIKGPGQLEGVSLAPWLLSDQWKSLDDRPAVLTVHGPGNFALRSRHFRYIRYADGTEELYDHRQDTQELKNLVALASTDARLSRQLELFRQQLPEAVDFVPGTTGMSSRAYPGR